MMAMVRVGLYLSMFLACCSYISAFVLAHSTEKGAGRYSKDIENRVIFLAKFLHMLNSAQDSVQTPIQFSSMTDSVKSQIDNSKSPTGVASHTEIVELPIDGASKTDAEKSYIENGLQDIADMIRIFEKEDTPNENIEMEKKDYAILPPASEWCRLMGFRRCRASQS